MSFSKKILLLILLLIWENLNAQLKIDNGHYLLAEKGIYLNVEGFWINNGHFVSDSLSFVKLLGGVQEISGTETSQFSNLIISGADNKILGNILTQKTEVKNTLVFDSQKIEINNNDLVLLSDAVIINANNQRYVVTAGTGRLIKKEVPHNVVFLFPVGSAPNSYTPVTINYAGIIDTFAVRVFDGVNPPDQTAVQKTYLVKSSNPGVSLADVSLAWHTADEGSLFLPAQAMMWQKQSGTWTMLSGNTGAVPNPPVTDWLYNTTGVAFHSNFIDSFIVKSAVPPLITLQAQDTAICETEDAVFTIGTNGLSNINYQWQINCSGTWHDLINGGSHPSYSGVNDSVLYVTNVPIILNGCSFRCIVTNAGGSDTSDIVNLTVFVKPLAYIDGNLSVCEGEMVLLTAYDNNASYIWSTGDTTQSVIVHPLPPAQDYFLTVTNPNSCTNTAHIQIHIENTIDIVLTSDFEPENIIISGQAITFTATPPDYHYYTYIIGNDTVNSQIGHVFQTNQITEDTWVIVIGYLNSCSSTDSLFIKIKQLPNAFTPYDKDGKNDIFGEGLNLEIFNRWGQMLYKGIEGWDGTYNGKRISPGTYFYTITLNSNKKNQSTIKGSVLLISND